MICLYEAIRFYQHHVNQKYDLLPTCMIKLIYHEINYTIKKALQVHCK